MRVISSFRQSEPGNPAKHFTQCRAPLQQKPKARRGLVPMKGHYQEIPLPTGGLGK